MSDITPGKMANKSGKLLEQTILGIFLHHGFEVVSRKDLIANPKGYGRELLITGVPYSGIYGHRSKSEFVAVSEKYGFEIRFECKWQQKAGSVDEKFPYLYLNCIEGMPESTIFIIYGGGGYKTGSIEWLKRTVKEGKYQSIDAPKDIRVYTLDEFLAWANRKLI